MTQRILTKNSARIQPACNKLAHCKGLMPLDIRLLFPIGFGDVADGIQVDGRLIRANIVRTAEPALDAARLLARSML